MGAAIPILMTIIQEGPAAVDFAIRTYKMFTDGQITEDQLLERWQQTVSDVKAANKRWEDS